jgi:hypothetical protein
MFSVSPFDVLEVAACPSLDPAVGSKFSVFGPAEGERVEKFSGAYFGLHGRLAIHVHPMRIPAIVITEIASS